MQQSNEISSVAPAYRAEPAEAGAAEAGTAEAGTAKAWTVQLEELLAAAAALGAQHGVDVEAFMRGAWSAYVDASPGLREHLEEMQLKSQLDELRKLGRIGEA